MKKYDKIRNLPLKDVFNSYIENNNLSSFLFATSILQMMKLKNPLL